MWVRSCSLCGMSCDCGGLDFPFSFPTLSGTCARPLKSQWVLQWLFYANSVRYATAMSGPGHAAFKNGWWDLARNLEFMKKQKESEKICVSCEHKKIWSSLEYRTVRTSQLSSLGLMISDKQAGQFGLEIDWIKAYRARRPTEMGGS